MRKSCVFITVLFSVNWSVLMDFMTNGTTLALMPNKCPHLNSWRAGERLLLNLAESLL